MPSPITLSAGWCRALFTYEHDRWGHEIQVEQGGAWQTWLRTCDGRPDQHPPLSPPFQDARCEQFEEQVSECQLMGQSGRTIYSAAVRANAREHWLDFDLCRRVRADATRERAGCVYCITTPDLKLVQPTDSTSGPVWTLQRAVGGRTVRLTIDSFPQQPITQLQRISLPELQGLEIGCLLAEPQTTAAAISSPANSSPANVATASSAVATSSAAIGSSSTLPLTLRWRYRLQVTES